MKTMKKRILIAILAVSLVALTACGKKENGGSSNKEPVAASAVELLEKVWTSYGEDEKFWIIGGDFSEENMRQDGPGKYTTEDPMMLEVTFAVPQSDASLIDDAASIIHAMNANTFTCGAFHINDESALEVFAGRLKDSVLNVQWMCGFPDKLVIFQVGDYVVSVYGNEELVDAFKGKMTDAYKDAVVLTDVPVM